MCAAWTTFSSTATARVGGFLNRAYAVTSASRTAIENDDLFNVLAAVPGPYRQSDKCGDVARFEIDIDTLMQHQRTARSAIVEGMRSWTAGRQLLCDQHASDHAAGAIPLLFGDISAHHIGMFGNIGSNVPSKRWPNTTKTNSYAWAMCDGSAGRCGLASRFDQARHAQLVLR